MPAPEYLSVRVRASRAEIVAGSDAMEEWPAPSLSTLPETQHEMYLKAKRAVQLWVGGADGKRIKQETTIKADIARRLARRCLAVNPRTKAIVGFWACVPKYRSGSPRRQRVRNFEPTLTAEGRGLTGALQDVFKRYPAIEEHLRQFVSTRSEGGSAPVAILTAANIHERFIALCKDHKLHQRHEWPFTVKRCGYEAVRRWYGDYRHENPARSIRNEFGDEASKLDKLDRVASKKPRPRESCLAYERVDMDEHHEDSLWSLQTLIEGNRFAHVASTRLWALVMRDFGSGCALASGVSYKQRYGSAEVLALAYGALIPPPRKSLIFNNIHYQYAEGACFPSEVADFRANLWQTLALDADRAHFSNAFLDALGHDIGCTVESERIGEATARYALENFFKNLATMNQCLPSATGNRPDSPARRSPEKAAERWNIVASLAEQMLDLKCRNYNVTPLEENLGISPIQKLHEMLAQGRFFRSPLGELRQENLYRFLPRYPATLSRKRGAKSLGPLSVQLFGGRYVGPELTKDIELSLSGNPSVTVYVQEDARYAFVVPNAFPSRCYAVTLTGAFSDFPHTLNWRRLACAFSKNAHICGTVNSSQLMTGVLRGLGEAAKTDNAVAAMQMGVVAFMDRFGRGDTTYVLSDPGTRERLTDYAQKMAEEEAGESDDELFGLVEVVAKMPSTVRGTSAVGEGATVTVGPVPGADTVADADPFGLL